MTINNIFEIFISKFPQLNEDINKNLKDNMVDTNDGIYVLWGMGVMPCVNKIIDNIENYEDLISSIFDFFEEMANGDDEELKDLLMYSTLETLGDDEKRLNISRQFMKNETKLLSEKVET
ncbi:DUF7674 family protein [Anaeromicropila populeti]|uniref:DUF7674 domain-containing protein n=1 Tax=Anaeromicropila populeti TaxID=37658 RepID=A0A1I6M3E0_9FIRM|nr:hypothetical protein [Anaeromicropila populeti]SFS10200.1 hypothetical protein SAMN05661086_03769 [Anaeromicropila populeti]